MKSVLAAPSKPPFKSGLFTASWPSWSALYKEQNGFVGRLVKTTTKTGAEPSIEKGYLANEK